MLRDPGLIPLSHDHHHALALCVFAQRALKANETAATIAARIVAQFETEIVTHFEFEEQVLFPALNRFPQLESLLGALLMEHRRMIVLVEQLRAAPTPAKIQEFVDLLRGHVHREERVLFERAQELLTRDELDAIGRARPPYRRGDSTGESPPVSAHK